MITLDNLRFVVTLLAALGSGLMAGLFFAFSVAVMKALGQRPPAEGMAAMQAINVVILNPLFFVVFFGTALASLLLVIASLLRWQQPGAGFLLFGAALYLVGGILVTMVFNVPRNDALAAAVATDPNSAALWADYLTSWTAWNHVRTVTNLAAAAALTIALCY